MFLRQLIGTPEMIKDGFSKHLSIWSCRSLSMYRREIWRTKQYSDGMFYNDQFLGCFNQVLNL